MSEISVEVHSLAEMDQLGRRLAQVLQLGDVVALIGNLGAGKTTLTKSIVMALGGNGDEVHSPTFVLIQEYEGREPICHIDAYRLRDTDEFLELGADELLGADNICLIEWADRVEDVLPRRRIEIRIESISESSRQIRLKCPSDRDSDFQRVLEFPGDFANES